MKIVTILGARPQFIKAGTVSREIKKHHDIEEIIVHTGQHFDKNMSDIFFEELKIPRPDFTLNVGSASHAKQTANIMIKFEDLCEKEKPDTTVVIGDVNSTVACVLVASKMGIKTAHIESGLRSFNKSMPEEINRIVTDHLSDLLFAPSKTAVSNLKREGLKNKTFLTGDVMYDAIIRNIKIAENKSNILSRLNLEKKGYYLATVHRPYNVDNKDKLKEIISAFSEVQEKIVLSVHPRLNKNIQRYMINLSENIIYSEPFSYLDFVVLEKYAKKIITDSGGIQKEAFFLKVPCITLRPETEWIETIELGANVLIKDRKKQNIINEIKKERQFSFSENVYGNGNASKKIINLLLGVL